MNPTDNKARISAVSDLLYQATRRVRILKHLAWPQSHRRAFLKDNALKLPAIEYPKFDPGETFDFLAQARRLIHGDSLVDAWLEDTAERIETSARLLCACGTNEFLEHSSRLYGTPKKMLMDENSTPLELAISLNKLFDSLAHVDVGAPAPACYLADYVAGRMRDAAVGMFGQSAPEVLVVDELSANALAGPKRIRIRRGAQFSDKDIAQLINHEVYIHVATSLNGMEQTELKILGSSNAGTTKTQEGLAVFAEFISGSMDIDRFRRLADRVVVTQMAIEGASFVDVYRYFLERAPETGANQAFENARRVFRGGTLSGGVPFTKDIVYLDGLLRVHNFLRTVVTAGRSDCLQLLFCGKLDIENIPVLCELAGMGLCRPPKYLPPWASDRRFLLSYLAYSSFLNSIDLNAVRKHYDGLLENSPVVDFP